ncbi:MAG TPA: hypothetical protein VI341_13425 [Actinomycetota bacterium]
MSDVPAYEIEVGRTDVERFMSTFSVRIVEGGSESRHSVTLSGADWERLGTGYAGPEDLIRESFRFLLANEPKEQILGSFDISQISTYFPDFERTISKPR